MTYGKWSIHCATLRGSMQFSFFLRGENLDLKGGSLYFWVLVGGKARFHRVDQPLELNGSEWTHFNVAVGVDGNGWHRSWSRGNEKVEFEQALGLESFGISIVGFRHAETPSGILAIDEVSILPREDFACWTKGAGPAPS
jgi:hypothetical protein